VRPGSVPPAASRGANVEQVIVTYKLCKRYAGVQALTNLGLGVERDQVFAFLGSNGAGKTTTMRLLVGLQKPTSGQIRLFGQDLCLRREQLLRRVRALIEPASCYRHLTGRENLEVVRRLRCARTAQIDEVLDMVGLATSADHLVRTYSKGMKQRLGIATALLGDPELVISDEPMNGLDPEGIRDIRELIAYLPERRGATVFVSSHLLHEVEQLATHVAVIHKGCLLFEGSLAGLRACAEPKISIGTDRPWQAKDVLACRFQVVTVTDTDLEIRSSPDRIPEIAHLLSEAGFTITRARAEKPSLEDLYFMLTTDRKAI
jgi:lantibiotic transport system ATP-binding protein